jgi:hypothetical protein
MAKRRAKSAAGASLSERWNAIRPTLVAGAWAFTLIGSALALGMGVPALRNRAMASRPEGPLQVVFADRPDWMTEDMLVPLANVVAEQVTGSAMERGGLASAREALQSTGWFEEVRQVRRTGNDEVTVSGQWAVPFAVVREEGYDHLVDLQGRLLPRCYSPGTAPRSLVRIEGAGKARPRTYGARWPGDDMSAALAVARLIEDRPWCGQIAWIDIGDMSKDGCLRLKTTRGLTVKWGRAPGHEGAAEVPAKQKLAGLDALHRQYGRIDGGSEEELSLLTDCVTVR